VPVFASYLLASVTLSVCFFTFVYQTQLVQAPAFAGKYYSMTAAKHLGAPAYQLVGGTAWR
jgi:hypothetical protein